VSGEALVTPEHVASYLAVSEDWIAEQARAGEIPAIKLGRYWRFRMSEIEEWLTTKASSTYKRRSDA
jgi:excisionase family DNA binding protein